MATSLQDAWEYAPRDPPLETCSPSPDEWEAIRSERCGRCHTVFLPTGGPDDSRESFIIVEESDLADPLENR